MNKEEAIRALKYLLDHSIGYHEALTMAIEALEQKPPVISDEETERKGYILGMKHMRELLTNKD